MRGTVQRAGQLRQEYECRYAVLRHTGATRPLPARCSHVPAG